MQRERLLYNQCMTACCGNKRPHLARLQLPRAPRGDGEEVGEKKKKETQNKGALGSV